MENHEINVERNSNIELCRIVCMLFIIAHHCVLHGGILQNATGLKYFEALLFYPEGKMFFVAYIAISTWFMIEKKFTFKRFFRMWLEVLFYSVLFSFIAWIYGAKFTGRDFLAIWFPIAGNSHGFASGYLAFMLLIPFLQKMTLSLTKKQSGYLACILLYFVVITPLFGTLIGYSKPFYSLILLFMLCFSISYYLKKWEPSICRNQIVLFFIIILISIFRMYMQYLSMANPSLGSKHVFAMLCQLVGDESSLLNIVGGYATFFFFRNLKFKNNKIINWIAPTTFGILLMHDHNFFRSVLWNNIVNTSLWWNNKYLIVIILTCSLTIFIIGMIIDKIRVFLLEEPILESKHFNIFIKKLENKFKWGMSKQ